jgi:hypothetical protein
MNDPKRKEYEEYFKGVLSELETEFEKSKSYSEKIDREINKLESSMPSRGGQLYLTEHIKNAIALQSQRQSIIKDKFSIMKSILDYSAKDNRDESAGKTLFEQLSLLVNADKEKLKNVVKPHIIQENLDNKIYELLGEDEPE